MQLDILDIIINKSEKTYKKVLTFLFSSVIITIVEARATTEAEPKGEAEKKKCEGRKPGRQTKR